MTTPGFLPYVATKGLPCGRSPCPYSSNQVTYLSMNRWRDVLPALEDMLAQGLVGDGRPFTVAIKALGDNGQTSRALRLLEVGAEPAAFYFLVFVVDLNFVAEFCCWDLVCWY